MVCLPLFVAMKRLTILSLVFLLFSCGSNNIIDKGNKLFQEGNYKEAVIAFTNHLELNPGDIHALYNRGRSYEELKQTQQAKADFDEVIRLEPNNFNAYLSLAKLFYDEGSYNKSLLNVAKAIKLNDDSEEAFFIKGRGEHHLGFSKEALESYSQAINLNNNFGDAYLYRGAVKVSMKYKSACADFLIAKQMSVNGADEAVNKYCQ